MNQTIEKPAGFWIRLLANLLDALIVSGPLALISYAIGDDRQILSEIIWGFYILLIPILWYGYTVGKRILGIRIAKVDGNKIGIGTMLMRTIVAGLIYGITLGIAAVISAFMVGFRQDKRAIHHLIAGTYVTFEKPGMM